jgi:hypothetical protein
VTVLPAFWPDPVLDVHGAVEYTPPLDDSHVYEYCDEPVDGIVPVTVSVWPESSFGSRTVGADGAVSAELRTTVLEDDVDVSGVLAESVTCSSKR